MFNDTLNLFGNSTDSGHDLSQEDRILICVGVILFGCLITSCVLLCRYFDTRNQRRVNDIVLDGGDYFVLPAYTITVINR